jgi:hypothetical protein
MPEAASEPGADVSLFALLFSRYPIPPRQETKIVWRVSGSGDVAFRAYGPDGQVVRLVWGPEAHAGSNWSRPGDEWGTAFRFPVAGCWTVRATRGSDHAAVGLLVAG